MQKHERCCNTMSDHAGMMSIDFMTGFTIFILAFIWVATMIPGLLIGLNAHPVDYDAVAYRTAVILAEDPGAASSSVTGPWEFQTDKRDIVRFGLARSKESPGVLDGQKVKKFFCSTAYQYPEDYQKRVIFGDYSYRFNISLRAIEDANALSVGDPLPEGYGFIRRAVKIRDEAVHPSTRPKSSRGDIKIPKMCPGTFFRSRLITPSS